ncbi:DUF192 domain-containing protein [Duganella sp. FT80W]|uniref:DUF192 domain-containing protein n=1 Tax=Duganella guangzhouensis TaxID=2666084 RepID=A0A6I2KXT1_9BURK|nr:DUF192 domain-containing protein [Duganella guangzhouensis]MRW90362.1 DUF192 domain-containing protein [Duganella guangzhouensis]
MHALRFDTHAIDVMVAASAPARMRGLLARPPLQAGQGMLIRPCNLIHTIGMAYAIDVVFLRRDGLVLKVASAVPPLRFRGHWRAHCVLELAAGEAARCAIVPGITLPIGALA